MEGRGKEARRVEGMRESVREWEGGRQAERKRDMQGEWLFFTVTLGKVEVFTP